MELKYGITKTNTGYQTEIIKEGKRYDMYIATSFLTTAGCTYNIVNEKLEDLISPQWGYHANYNWGCVICTGYTIIVTLKKRAEEIKFIIEESDDMHSEFVQIMMLIANTCKTMDDAKQLLNKYHYDFEDMEEHRKHINEIRSEQTSSSPCFLIEYGDETQSMEDDLPF